MDSNGFDDAVVQLYGSSKDVVIRLAQREDVKAEMLGNQIIDMLKAGTGQETKIEAHLKVGSITDNGLAGRCCNSLESTIHMY